MLGVYFIRILLNHSEISKVAYLRHPFQVPLKIYKTTGKPILRAEKEYFVILFGHYIISRAKSWFVSYSNELP